MTKMQRTVEVQHPENHYASEAQQRDALKTALEAEGYTMPGEYTAKEVENVSGSHTKTEFHFEVEDKPEPTKGK